MLLEDKIATLLSVKSTKLSDRYDFMISTLGIAGKFPTKNVMLINILFYLLEQQFEHDYLNRELYKKLLHFINITEITYFNSDPAHPVSPVTPAILPIPDALDFGNVDVGDEKVMSFNLTSSNIEDVVTVEITGPYTFCLNTEDTYQTNMTLLPEFIQKNSTLPFYVKFSPTVTGTNVGGVTFFTSTLSDQVSLTGEGIAVP